MTSCFFMILWRFLWVGPQCCSWHEAELCAHMTFTCEFRMRWSSGQAYGCLLYVRVLRVCSQNDRNVRMKNRLSPPSGSLADLVRPSVPGLHIYWGLLAFPDPVAMFYLIQLLWKAQVVMHMCCLSVNLVSLCGLVNVSWQHFLLGVGVGYTIIHRFSAHIKV